MWELYVCIAATGWGCGVQTIILYPTEAECRSSLAAIRIERSADTKTTTVAYCRPINYGKKP